MPAVQVPSPPPVPPVPQLPAAPAAPQVKLPSAPAAPAPSVPQTGSLPGGGVQAPSLGGSIGTTGTAIARTLGIGSWGGAAGGAATQKGSDERRSAAAGREAAGRAFRRDVKRLEPCFYALPEFDHRVLSLRAGLGGRRPRSRGYVAKRLHVATRRVRSSEGHGLRRLRRTNRSDHCAVSPSSSRGRNAAHDAVQAMAALIASGGGQTIRASTTPQGESDVRGAEASGQSEPTPLALATPPDGGGADAGLIAALLAAVLAMAAGLLLLRRRGPAGTGHASTAGEAAPEAGADESRDRLNGDSLIPAPPWARKNGAGDQSAAGGQQSERSRR